MNWKTMQFERETLFPEPSERVLEAVYAFAAQKLSTWQISKTDDGFEGKGQYWAAAEVAKLRVEPSPSGSKLTITLEVQRATPFGYMLVDAFGFYAGQINKWLEGIRWNLTPEAATAPHPPTPSSSNVAAQKSILGCLGCSMLILLLSWVVQSIYAIIGLITGSLYLLPYRESHGVTLHGPIARIMALSFLLIDAFFIYALWKDKKKREQPKILP